ncbi:hypothetical protein HOLleu_06500 [Holothuria leucospilota]|uniref:Uncharacterized protein n=1 Tax=Holothuria leucospilota TaxID=206669 RepID=A0A9Q1HI38_HOLLE|nr:hypothetical protein HOLleu_06500 [Holothuria leucospilota]
MKPAFGDTIGIVGVAVLLFALLILAISCLVIKTRRKPSKTDKRKAVNTPTLSNSAAESVINPAYESAENDRCFPMLDGPEDVYNPGYELNTTGVTGKKYEDQQNFSNQTSSSSGLDVPEEIYNPAYETSAEARDNDHMYHYVDIGNKEQMKTTIPQEESQYQYADFQGNENLAELTL